MVPESRATPAKAAPAKRGTNRRRTGGAAGGGAPAPRQRSLAIANVPEAAAAADKACKRRPRAQPHPSTAHAAPSAAPSGPGPPPSGGSGPWQPQPDPLPHDGRAPWESVTPQLAIEHSRPPCPHKAQIDGCADLNTHVARRTQVRIQVSGAAPAAGAASLRRAAGAESSVGAGPCAARRCRAAPLVVEGRVAEGARAGAEGPQRRGRREACRAAGMTAKPCGWRAGSRLPSPPLLHGAAPRHRGICL